MLEGRFRVGKGEHVRDHVDPRGLLLVVQSGTFKSEMQVSPGRVRVLDLHDAGDFMAVEAVLCGPPPDLIALETSFVCAIRAERLEAAAARQPAVQRHLWQLMSGLLMHAYQTLLVLGRLQAGERLAWYLLQLSQRRKRCGLDPNVVHLPMTREDIGNHLGIRPETVSRLFTLFYRKKLIERDGAHVRILDAAMLRELTDAETVGCGEPPAADPADRPPVRTTHGVPVAPRVPLRDARPGCAPLLLDTV